DQPAQGRAALAGGAGRGEDHPAQGQVDVRARRHDGTVVAAELEQDPAEALGHDGADLTSHPHRAGRRDQGHSIISDHDVADVPTGPPPRPSPPAPVPAPRASLPSRTIASPLPRPPPRTGARPSAPPTSAAARDSSDCAPRAASTAFSEGFHTTASPATSASA